MIWLKQNWIKVAIGITILGVLIFANRWNKNTNTALISNTASSLPNVETENPSQEALALVKNVYSELNTDAISGGKDPKFSNFVLNELESLCPFYKPDGATYRGCLYNLLEKKKQLFKDSKALKEYEDYCGEVSKPYGGTQASDLFMSCMIYKLN